MEKFPSRYLALTTRLLEQLKGSVSEDTLNKLFTQLASDMAHDHFANMDMQKLAPEDRLELLQKILQEEGFVIEVERVNEKYLIKETSCPYYHVGQEHPEVCIVDKTLISTVLDTPVEKITCMLDGDSICAYEVPVIAFADVD